jgi:iron complex outermembrane receptor protein
MSMLRRPAHRPAGLAAMLTALFAAPAAEAQSIDHNAFEALFGEPVTTSATGAPQRASEVPAAMIIVTGDELRRLGARNLAEALKGRAGIDVIRMTAQDDEVAVRGGSQPSNPRLLVMVNGRQVYLEHYGLTSWANLGVELSEIRQIEVVKGPVSALYGFNAASGAINIVTDDPLVESRNVLSGEIGNDGQRAASVVGTLRLGEVMGLRLSGGYSVEDEFATVGPAGTRQPTRGSVALDLHAHLSPQLEARVNLAYTDARATVLPPGFFAVAMHYVTRGGLAELAAETGVGLLSLQVQHNDLDNGFELAPSDGVDRAFEVHLTAVRLQDIVKASAHDTIRATVEFRRDDMMMEPDLAGRISYGILSGGLMWDRRLSDAVTLNLAGRIDRLERSQSGVIAPSVTFAHGDFDTSLTAWSANAGLVIKAGERSTVRIQAARGVQAPSLVSTGIAVVTPVMPGVNVRLMGMPTMAPTISDSAEIGYARDLSTIAGKFAATLFWSRTRDVALIFDYPPLPTPQGLFLDSSFVNHGNYESYGLEATLAGEASKAVRWQLDYTLNALDEHFAASFPATSIPFRAMTPRHKFGATISLDVGRMRFDLRGLLRSQVGFPYNGRVSGWTAGLNGRVGFALDRKFELYAAGENLTDAAFIDNGYVRQGMRVRVGLRISG